MNKQARISKIEHLCKKTEPYGKQDILWHGKLTSMNVFEIPLECLIYNRQNGRILSRTKTLDSQGKKIDPETKAGKKTIEDLLWDSKETRNENTLRDLREKGQLKVGIITRDGIVIDGNRRVMLLNRLKKSHFRAIVLPVMLEDDLLEVEKLETTYQMGEDEKLGYNPIEKYLKSKQIYKKLTENFSHEQAVKQISDWMGESTTEIEEWLQVVDVIDEYLEYHKYNGIYAMADTHNDGKEDLFLFLRKWINTYSGKQSGKAFDNYTALDVDELKQICFDYIRAKIGESYDGKKFRHIADGSRENHFFGDKHLWKSFSEKHFNFALPAIEKINNENPIDYDSDKIEMSLSHRDCAYRDLILDKLIANIDEHKTTIGFKKAENKPAELIGSATKAIAAINPNHKNFSTPEVLNQVDGLVKKLTGLVKIKSPEHALSNIVEMLNDIKLDNNITNKPKVLARLKEIQQLAQDKAKEIKA